MKSAKPVARHPHTPAIASLDREVAKKILELFKLPIEKRLRAFATWLASAGTPELIAQREKKIKDIFDYAEAASPKNTPRQPPIQLCAFVFCDCYEKGRLKRQPPNPDLVVLLPNGDLDCPRATPAQHDAFVAWRSHACRHPEGVITGGKLGRTFPADILYALLCVERRAFPVLAGKVLNCRPQTRNSHLARKNIQKLQLELRRLRTFRFGVPKIDRELTYLYRQMRQLVREALKINKPIAI